MKPSDLVMLFLDMISSMAHSTVYPEHPQTGLRPPTLLCRGLGVGRVASQGFLKGRYNVLNSKRTTEG